MGGRFLHFLGGMSLELYLIHMKVIPILMRFGLDGSMSIVLTLISTIILAFSVRFLLNATIKYS